MNGANEVNAAIGGSAVQANSIHGGVHLHGVGRSPIVPRQLPAAMADFVGRTDQLEQLTRLLDRETGTVVISAINGSAGIGKTTLAVHWAHRVAHRFPDGHLYVNLRGFDPSSSPMTAAEAIRGFLDAFGIDPRSIPVSFDAQAAMYRSILADRRVLVVLDNARSADQVRPLLPGSPSCLVLITSRDGLDGLVVKEGARPVELDLMSPGEARDLLTSRISGDKPEPPVLDELATHCARLPLALAIVSARAAGRVGGLDALVEELRDEEGRLDALDVGDPSTTARTVFSWSYRALSAPAARMFRLLGLHTAADIGLPAAASLAGSTPARVRALLSELTRAHLVEEHVPGRFRFHDLLRAYAAERANTDEPDQGAAVERLLDHYLYAGLAASHFLDPRRDTVVTQRRPPDVVPIAFASYQQAMDWFVTEHATLVAAVRQAAEDFDRHAWQLPWTMVTYLRRQGHFHDRAAMQRIALAAACRLGDTSAEGHAHRLLGNAVSRLGDQDAATEHHTRALALFRELGAQASEANTLLARGRVLERLGRFAEAEDVARQALSLFEAAATADGTAAAFNAVGRAAGFQGRYREALDYCESSLRLYDELGTPEGMADVLHTIGLIRHGLGEYESAADHFRRSIELDRDLGDRYYEAFALSSMGDTYWRDGKVAAAVDVWQQALEIFEQLDHPDAADVRAKLCRVDVKGRHAGPEGSTRA